MLKSAGAGAQGGGAWMAAGADGQRRAGQARKRSIAGRGWGGEVGGGCVVATSSGDGP